MEFRNIIVLTILAILTDSSVAATCKKLGPANALPVRDFNFAGFDGLDLQGQVALFKAAYNGFPNTGPLTTKQGLYEAQDAIFSGITREELVTLYDKIHANMKLFEVFCFNLKSESLKSIVDLITPGVGWGCNVGQTLLTCANKAAEDILAYTNPANWPANVDLAKFQRILLRNLGTNDVVKRPLALVNKIPARILEGKPVQIVRYLQHAKADQIHLVDSSVLKKLLKTSAAVRAITAPSFAEIIKNPDLAKLFDGKTFNELNHNVKTMSGVQYSKYVRNLPKDAYTHVNTEINKVFLQYATKEQVAKFQTKCQDADRCLLRPSLIHQHYTGEVDFKVWRKYFKQYAAEKLPNTQWYQDETASMKTWSFWKRIPMKAFKTLVEKNDVGTLLPVTSFKLMSKEQRDLILKAGDKESPSTTCANLPLKVLKGKPSRLEGLSISNKCLKAKLEAVGGVTNEDKGKWAFAALQLGIVQPKAAKKLPAAVVKHMKVTLARPRKADKDGKMKKREDVELDGLLAFEGLRNLPNGAEYVKAFFSQDSDAPAEACKAIDHDKLKKCEWLQPLLSKKCVKAMRFDLDELAKLNPHITACLSKDQLEQLGGRADLKALSENVAAGLGKNSGFAKIALELETKEKDDKEVSRKYRLQLIKAEQVKKHFGAEFVAAVPEQHMEGLAKVMPGLSDSALAKADAAWIASHAAVVKAATDEQHGHISDDVEASGYPASLSVGAVMAMPVSRVKALSPKFVGKMTASGISAFSAEQVAAIPAESLCLVCGDKAAAFKHELSPAQKESLGKDCPAAKDSMAPSQFGAIAALAAAAAGSIALLL